MPPENETAELAAAANQATPDEMMDLKRSSGDEITIDMVRRQQAQAEAVPAAATGIAWQQLGPYNIGGRMTDVVALGNNAVLGSAASGGIWKSTDGGANWTSIWPDANVQAMGAIAKAPDGTLWAGTGEANPPGGGLTYFGDGIYKSTDDGAHLAAHGPAGLRRVRAHRGRPDELEPRVRGGGGPHRPLGLRSAASTAPRTPARPGSA